MLEWVIFSLNWQDKFCILILKTHMSKKRKKLKKKNPMAKLLSSPMLRNKIVKNKKKIYNRKKFKLENK